MKITRRRIALFVLPLFAALLAGCGDTRQDRYQGWVEGVFIFVGPDEAGRVENLVVREGDVVAEGAALFAVGNSFSTRAWFLPR
jgi:multidrug efflux pump subunit AcrA (membrane-fusion protein)